MSGIAEQEELLRKENLKTIFFDQNISLTDIAMSLVTAFFLVVVATEIVEFFAGIIPSGEEVSFGWNLLSGLEGDQYLVLTTLMFLSLPMKHYV